MTAPNPATSDPRAEQLRSGYAAVAEAYADELSDELAGKPLDRAWLAAFAEQAPAGLVLEVGCGPGQVARFVADRGREVEGIDLSPQMIEAATARHPQLRFRVADMFELPYADAAVAGVVAFYAIVHLQTSELVAPLCEMHRVLATGGLLALAFHIGSETVHVDELFGCATSLDFVMHAPDAVIAALQAAGFTIEARLVREPYALVEHPSQRCYLLARK